MTGLIFYPVLSAALFYLGDAQAASSGLTPRALCRA